MILEINQNTKKKKKKCNEDRHPIYMTVGNILFMGDIYKDTYNLLVISLKKKQVNY